LSVLGVAVTAAGGETKIRHIQADRFGDTSAVRLVESAVPEPSAGQVRLRVHAAGVNPADVYILGGSYAFYTLSIPYTPGFDVTGQVDAVGAGITGARHRGQSRHDRRR
jgi:NADPH2:quinone reductase